MNTNSYSWTGISLEALQKQREEMLAAEAIKEDPYIEFQNELLAHGLDVQKVEVTGAGNIIRVPVADSKRGNKNGWYTFEIISDVAFGWYGNWLIGSSISFRSDNYNKMSPAQRREIDERAALAKEMAESARIERARKAKEKANDDLKHFASCAQNYDHPYLVNKQVGAYGLYTDSKNLYIPLRDFAGEVVSYQAITEEGGKFFLKDGEVKGCYHFIQGTTKQWVFVEGYATGATIHEATGANVMVCFNAGNLYEVVARYRNTTNDPIIIGADNDHKKPKNAGLDVANKINEDFSGITIKYPEGIEGSDFNDMACEVGIDTVKRAFNSSSSLIEIIKVDDYELTEPEWFIKNWLPKENLVLMFGPSGHMKSFMVIDQMMHLAAGMNWNGNKVKDQHPILYLCGEGASGIKRRVMAWKEYHQYVGDLPFYMTKAPVALLERDQTNQLIGAVQDYMLATGLDRYPSVIVVDTLNRNFGAGDENSTKDMTQFIESCKEVAVITGSTFYIIHHSGNAESERARGSSALHAACDSVFKVAMTNYDKAKIGLEEPEIELQCVKMKDAAEPRPISFVSDVVFLGEDSDGDPITSCALAYQGESRQMESSVNDEELLSFLNKPVASGKNKAEQYRLILKDAVLACIREVASAGAISCFVKRDTLNEVYVGYCKRHDLFDGNAHRKQRTRAFSVLEELGIIKHVNTTDTNIAISNTVVIRSALEGVQA